MKIFKKHELDKAKKSIEVHCNRDYEALLELAAQLYILKEDADKVIYELSIPRTEPSIISVSSDGVERKTQAAETWLKIMASTGNESAKYALENIYSDLDKGRKFKAGKPKNSIEVTQKYINELVANNPKMTAKELMRLADINIIGDMKDGTFGNKTTKARKLL